MFARALIAAVFLTATSAHSFLTVPMPISRVETCRVGGNPGFEANCAGPCPIYDLRQDMRPENPAATYERGQRVTIHWSKNNHVDGFVRLALVPLGQKLDKAAHWKFAFYFGCWKSQEYRCTDVERHRDCYYDKDNKAYKTQVTIPTVYPDGVYVLGWTWYGGGHTYGSFGDYWDCSYVQIKGGPLKDTFPAVFESRHGYCMASVNRLGVCRTEPCRGEYWSKPRVPYEFRKGAPVLKRWWFDEAMRRQVNRVYVAKPKDFGISGFSIMSSHSNLPLDVDQDWVIAVDEPIRFTLVPNTFGKVTKVLWIVNGEKHTAAFSHPWSVAGQQRYPRGGWNYFPWKYPVLNKRVFVTVIAWNGNRKAYYSKDLVFRRKNGKRSAEYVEDLFSGDHLF